MGPVSIPVLPIPVSGSSRNGIDPAILFNFLPYSKKTSNSLLDIHNTLEGKMNEEVGEGRI